MHSLGKAGRKIYLIRQAEGQLEAELGTPRARGRLALGQREGQLTACPSRIVVPGGASQRPRQHPVAKTRSTWRLIGV